MTRFYGIDFKGTPRHVVEEQGEWRLIEGDLFGAYSKGDAVRAGEHRLLAPIVPSKIVAIGLNYKDHAAEVNKPPPADPLMFIKPSTAVIGPDFPIVIPEGAGRVDHEYIQEDGTLKNRKLFCSMGSDGMTLDEDGNLYLTGKRRHRVQQVRHGGRAHRRTRTLDGQRLLRRQGHENPLHHGIERPLRNSDESERSGEGMTGPRTISVPVVFALVAGVGLVSLTVGAVFLLSIRNPVVPPTQAEPFKPLPDRPKSTRPETGPETTDPRPPPQNPAPVADPVRVARLESAPAPRPSRCKVGNTVEQEVIFTRKSVYHVQGIEVAQAAEYSVISDFVVESVTPDGGCKLTQTIRSTRLTQCDPALRQDMQAALEKTHGTRFAIVVGPGGEVQDFKGPKDGVHLQVPNDPGRTATFRVWSSSCWRGSWAEITLLQPPAKPIDNAWDRPIYTTGARSADWPATSTSGRTDKPTDRPKSTSPIT